MGRPPRPDEHSVAGKNAHARRVLCRFEIRDGHLVAGVEDRNSVRPSNIEENTSTEDRFDGVDSKPRQTVVGLGIFGAFTAVHDAVLADMAERVDVGANVATKNDHLVRSGSAI